MYSSSDAPLSSLPLREGVDLNIGGQLLPHHGLRLPLREGVDLNDLCLVVSVPLILVSLCVREWI